MFFLKLFLSLALTFLPGAMVYANGWSWNFPPQYVNPTSAKRNNIFYVGEAVTINIGSGATRYEVRDYYGNIVTQNAVTGSTLTLNVTAPGWYKLYLYGNQDQGAPWSYAVGSTTFVIFRDNPNFPKTPTTNISGGYGGLDDEVLRGITGLGPQRISVDNPSDPDTAIAHLEQNVTLAETWYLPYDPIRKRDLLIAFPNGTTDLAGVRKIVDHFKTRVKYWEARNEPNFAMSATNFVNNELKPFYDTVKSINPNLKVLGPGVVGLSMIGWIDEFLNQGGGNCIDAFSFHGYATLGGDIWLARTSLDSVKKQLADHGIYNMELWQTEFGHMAAVYGSYQPRHQGAATMSQMMIFEQYGIPKEHNHLWYDKSGGFWDFPCWVENDDGGLNPGAALMRVWSEELYGLQFKQALDFGPVDNRLYIGNLFSNGGPSVAAFMAVGDTTGSVQLRISSGSSVKIASPFGVESDLPVVAGIVTVPVGELPVYVHLASGQTMQLLPRTYGDNLTRQPGVVVNASGSQPYPTDPNDPNCLQRLVNGVLENWTWRQWPSDGTWLSNVTSWPATIEVAFPQTAPVSDIIIHATAPWQVAGTLLDYEIQAWNGQGWTSIEHVVEPTKTFKNYTPAVRCTVDSFFSERHVFEHHFAPVTTNKIRLLVNDVTFGGGATADVVEAGGQTGPHQVSLREIEVFQAPVISAPFISQNPESKTLLPGDSQTLSVVAQGGGTLSYLWKKGGAPIANAMQSSLVLTNATSQTSGTYTVTVSNSAGQVISQAATITVATPFNQWAARYFSPEQLSQPGVLLQSQPMTDGISVLEKYYFGLDPLRTASASDRARLPKASIEKIGSDAYFTLTYTTNPQASDVTILPQKGTLSGTWQTSVADSVANLTPDPATGNPRVALRFKIGPASTGFYRLSLTVL